MRAQGPVDGVRAQGRRSGWSEGAGVDRARAQDLQPARLQ